MIIASLMVAIKNAFAGLVRGNGAHALVVAAALLAAIPPVGAQTVTALQDTTCAGFRAGSLTCTAGEFTVTPTFAAASGTSPYCIAGQTFTVNVSIGLSGTNANRYNIGFFVGQQGNDPRATTAGNICSAATFPTSPAPFENYDGNACGDYLAGGVSTPIVQSIKVVCAAASGSDLGVPYTLTYNQNTGTTCTGPADVINSSPSKCNAGTATINVGAVPIQVAGYVDLTKVTVPAGDTQSFAFTATGSSSTPSPASFNLTHGATQRIYMPVGSTNSTLTIVESATTNWETTASISCAAQSGSPALTTDGATRTITAQLNTTDKAASCTITNTKKARITLVKAVGGRVVAGDQFTVSASGGGTLTGTTSATTSATGTSASTVIYSTPGAALTLSDAMAAGSTSSIGDYLTSLSCTNAYTGTGATANASLPNNLITSSTSITPAPADDITCTYTNTPKPRVTLQKAIAGTGGRVSATDQFTLTISGATPVTTTGSGSAVTSAAALLVGTAGTAVTLTETAAGSTNLANYATTYSCTNSGTGGTTVASGSGTSFSFTPANNDVIACTFTNTRKSATLRLAKTWVNAVVNDAVSLSATGINSRAFASVANTASETDTDATTMVVAAGETVALAESFTTGVAANYGVSLSCSGNNGALTYTPGSLSGSLAISGADTAITCTFVNSPKPRITLQKALGAGGRILLTDQFTLSMTGAGSVTTTGTGSAVTSSAVSLTGTAGSAITLSESASGTTNLAKYTSTYSCTNSGAGGTTVTPGTGTSFSFTPANNDVIACTFTNTQNVAPTIAKAFSPSSIAYGGTSTITFTITNSNGSALTAAQFGDTLVNMSVSAAGPAGGTCTGASGNVFTAGQTALTITGLTIPASASCTVTVVVTSTSPGSNPNSTTGVISNEAPTGAASNTATLTVASGLAPTISKAFGAATIASGGATSLTFTISNPNSVISLSGINFTDTLPTSPGAMTVANSTVTNTCTGSSWQGKTGAGAYAAPAVGNTALQLSGLTLAAGASCTVSVNITATTAGSYTNTSGAVAATGPIPLTGSTASASLIVLAAPAVTKSFTVSNVAIGGSTTQTITIQNSSTTTALTGVAFTDTYPAGMSGGVGSISGSGCTGTLSGTAGSLTLSGGTIPASTSCSYTTTVTGTAAGAQINSTGAITSSNAPNGSAASATLNVYTAPTVTKTFSPAMIATGGTSSLSIVVTNPAANPGNLSGVSINDAYTGTLSNNAAGSVSCSGGGSATLSGGVNGGTSVGFTSGTIVPGGSCTITQSVTATSTNTNATNAPTATGPVALTGTAATGVVLNVVTAPTVSKSFLAGNVSVGGSTTMNITVTNPVANTVALSGVAFTDTYPAGMSGALSGSISGAGCTGTLTAASGSLALNGGTVPVNTTCTYSVTVTGTAVGAKLNSTGAVSSTNAPNGTAATATLNVYIAPTVTKTFTPATIAAGGTSSLSIVVTNPAANPGNLSGVSINDAYTGTLSNNAAGSVSCSGGGSATLSGGANGGTSVGFTSGTIVPGGSCTITQSVTATSTNTNATNAPTATGPVALTGTAATGVVLNTVIAPTVTKSFASSNVAVGATTTLNITVSNPAANTVALSGVAFTDTYPAGMAGALSGSISGAGCTGTLTAASGSLSLAGGTVPVNITCTYSVTVTGTAAGAQINSTGAITSSNAPNGSAASATLNVYTAPTVTKTFSPATIAAGGTSSLSIVVTNPAANPGNLSGVSINDAYTGTLSNNAAGSVSCSGGGSATLSGGVNGGTSVGFTSGTIVPGGSCTITQSVTATSTNTNATNAPTATGPVALTGTAVTGVVLTVSSQPTIAKSFAASQVALGGSVNMSFQITNPNPTSLSGLAFNDSLPAGLTAGNGTTASCGGSMVISGGNTLSFSGGTLAASASCTITVAVTGSTAGVKNNTTGVISSNESGAGTTSNTATVTVLAPLTISKTFAASDIALGGSTTLTITISNANGTTAISGVSFTDPLPSGLTAVNGSSVFCGGTLTVSGGNLLSFSGGSVAAGGSCVITATVTGATAGAKANTTTAVNASGPINLNGAASNTATVNVYAPPTISKAFAVGGIALNASTTLNITVSNPNAGAAIGGISFTDPLPAGLTAVNGSSSACGGTLTVSGTNLLSFSGGTLAAGASCVIGTTITGSSSGVKANTTTAVSAGSPIALAGAVSNTANLTVSAPPTISKSFASANVALGGSVNMSFVISNPNSTSLSGIAVTDTLPAGLSAANGSSATCGGSLVVSGNNLLSFSGGTLAGNASCTITVAVTGIAAGIQNNTTGAVSSSESGAGATSNTATVNVAGAPTIVKSFAAPTVALGGNVNMSFVISNPNIFGLSGLAFGDTLPAGLSAVNGTAAVCGGSLVTSGANTLTFTGGTLAAGASCTITVAVTGIAAGVQNNTTSAISSTESGSGAVSNTATVTVLSPPTLAKSFTPATIGSGGVSTLTITIGNPNNAAITVGSLLDTFPTSPGAGLVRAATPNAATTCSGGSETSTAASVTLSGGTVPANGSCTVQIDVSAASSGSYINTIAAGALSSSAGSNAAAASATLTVTPVANVSVTKSGPATIAWGSTITYTAVVSNAGPDAANSTVFSDAVPAAISGVSASCGSATGGAVCGTVNLSGNNVSSIIASLPAGASLTFTIQGTAPQTGTLSNSASAIVPSGISDPDDPGRTGAGNNSSAAVSTIVQAPDLRLVKTSASNFTVGSTAVFTLTVSNSGNAPTSGTITVVDTLPTGLSYNAAGSGGTGWSCSSSGQVVTCTSGDVIAAAGSGNPIAINVGISSAAAPGVTNVANVAGGNEPAFYAGNNGALLTVSVVFPGGNTFNTDGVQSGLPGTALFYPHTFKAGLGGSVGFSTTDTASPPISGWGVTIFRDVNCNGALDGTEGNTPMSGSVAVVPGDQVCIVVKSTIPATAAYNSQDTIAVAANFTPTSGAPSTLLRQDVTTVGPLSGAGLTLAKSVRNVTQGGSVGTSNSARPGDTLEYIIVYTNTTNGAISTIVISDAVPAFTGYVSGNCVTPLPAVLTGCAVTTAPAVGAAGNIQWTLSGPLNPNTSGSVLFRVVVQ